MLLRPFLYEAGSCASYLFGCLTHQKLAVVDPHVGLVDDYLAAADAAGSRIAAVFETHVQADHVSGLPALARTGATAYVPVGAGVEFEHVALADGGEFASALLADAPPRPADQDEVVAANRSGRLPARA